MTMLIDIAHELEATCEMSPGGAYYAAECVVQTMLEPTDAMLNAARDWSAAKYGKPIGNEAAIGVWQVMLNAAASG